MIIQVEIRCVPAEHNRFTGIFDQERKAQRVFPRPIFRNACIPLLNELQDVIFNLRWRGHCEYFYVTKSTRENLELWASGFSPIIQADIILSFRKDLYELLDASPDGCAIGPHEYLLMGFGQPLDLSLDMAA